jgi:hypothetical protein
MPNGRTPKSDAMNERKIGESGIFYPEWFWEQGFRFADIMILVKKGKAEQVAKEIFEKFETCLMTSWRVNSIANLVAQVYYGDSNELKDIIEGILEIDYVDKVEFTEYVKIVERKSYEQVERDLAIRAGA